MSFPEKEDDDEEEINFEWFVKMVSTHKSLLELVKKTNP
jgi:hypothetical protein